MGVGGCPPLPGKLTLRKAYYFAHQYYCLCLLLPFAACAYRLFGEWWCGAVAFFAVACAAEHLEVVVCVGAAL